MLQPTARLSLVLALCAAASLAQTLSRTIHGTVHDQLGYVVAGARITVRGPTFEHAVTSARDGSFRVEGAPQEKLELLTSEFRSLRGDLWSR